MYKMMFKMSATIHRDTEGVLGRRHKLVYLKKRQSLSGKKKQNLIQIYLLPLEICWIEFVFLCFFLLRSFYGFRRFLALTIIAGLILFLLRGVNSNGV